MKNLLFMLLILPLFSIAQNATKHIVLGNQYYQQSQFDVAEVQYRKALEYDPDNEKAKYNLANALQKQNKYDDALKLLRELSASSKDQKLKSAANYNQGVAYSKLRAMLDKKSSAADAFLTASIEAYKQALRLNPSDQEARENLQKALLEQKKQNSSSQSQSKSSMSQKEAQQKLDMLNQKEKQLHQKKDKQNQGNGQSQDW